MGQLLQAQVQTVVAARHVNAVGHFFLQVCLDTFVDTRHVGSSVEGKQLSSGIPMRSSIFTALDASVSPVLSGGL